MSYLSYTVIKVLIGIVIVIASLAISLINFARSMEVPSNKTEWK